MVPRSPLPPQSHSHRRGHRRGPTPLPVPPPPTPPAQETDLSNEDAKRLVSVICYKEELLDKKRRWLMGSHTASTSEGNQKRPRNPKFLTDVCLPESHIRSDEVSCDSVRTNVDRSFGSAGDTPEHHVIKDYLHLFDLGKMENNSINSLNFLKTFSSIIDNLSNVALFHVANIVTDNKISFVKTRPRMKKIIKEYLPKVLVEANFEEQLVEISQIFRNPKNFREKQLTLATPATPALLLSIHETMGLLDKMPYPDLLAANRELREKPAVPPQFPVVLSGCKRRDLLIKRVRKNCQKSLSTIEEGGDLPRPLSKALSVMLLSLKHRTRCVDIRTSEFFPFSPQIIGLQNDILRALWSLPKVVHVELVALYGSVDPESQVTKEGFREALKKYLMECLFQCDEMDTIPVELLKILAFVNRRSRRRPLVCSKEMRDEDIEAVLNVSSQLKQFIQNLCSIEETTPNLGSETLESDDDSGSNDFSLVGNNYYTTLGEGVDWHIQRSRMNDEAEATGDSRPVAYPESMNTNGDYSPELDGAARGMIIKAPKLEEDADINHRDSSLQESDSTREIMVQEICDDTSLFSYKLIGHMVDNLLQVESKDVDVMARYYLRGGSGSSPVCSQGTEDTMSARIRNGSVDELFQSLPKSCVERVKKLIGMT